MQRVRRDSASSTDSWSIIEQRVTISENSLFDLENESGSDSEIEIAKEAFDSHDSDIEIEEDDHIEEEEEKENEEIQEQEENEEIGVEDTDSEEEEEEMQEEETQDWGLLSQKEAMSGDGKRYVSPDKIKNRLDSFLERRDNSQRVALFLKISFACFVIQNLALFYSLLISRPIYHPPEFRNIRAVSLANLPIKSFVYNNSASLQCWSPRAAALEVQAKKVQSSRALWTNGTLFGTKKTWSELPTFPKVPKPTRYGKTTISKQRSSFPVCKKRDTPPTLPKTLFPCKQKNPMPTPPRRKEPQSPFSALRHIMGQGAVEVPTPRIQPVKESKIIPPSKTIFKTSAPLVIPRAKKFNYKLEMTPVPKPLKSYQKKSHKTSKDLIVLPKKWKMSKVKKIEIFKLKKMVIEEKKKYSMKASQLMRNSSYSHDIQQCKREDIRQFKMLADKSRRRRQRFLEYKVEKPCRAIYEEKVLKKSFEKTSKKVEKLQAKIQKKIQKIEKKIRRQFPLSSI